MTEEISIEEKIAKATGRQLFQFMRALAKRVDYHGNISRYHDLAMKRARELVNRNYGNWEDAKRQLDLSPAPYGLVKNTQLASILGYQVFFNANKKQNFLAIINNKTNTAHIRDLVGLCASPDDDKTTTMVKNIFNS